MKSVFNPVFFLIITFTPSLSLPLSLSVFLYPTPNTLCGLHVLAWQPLLHTFLYICRRKARERKKTRESEKGRRGDLERFNCSAYKCSRYREQVCIDISFHWEWAGKFTHHSWCNPLIHEVWALKWFLFTSGLVSVHGLKKGYGCPY